MPSGILFIPHRRRRLLRRSPYLFVYSGYIVLLCSTSSNVDVKQTGMGNLCGWICSCLRRSVSTPPPPHPFTSILHVFVLYSSFTTSNAGAGASGMGWVCNCQSTKETRFSTLYTQSLWTVERTDGRILCWKASSPHREEPSFRGTITHQQRQPHQPTSHCCAADEEIVVVVGIPEKRRGGLWQND